MVGIPGIAHCLDSRDAALGNQSWRVEGSLDTALPCLAAVAVAGSTGGMGSQVGSLSTGACGEQGLGLQWLFLPVGKLGAPATIGCWVKAIRRWR